MCFIQQNNMKEYKEVKV